MRGLVYDGNSIWVCNSEDNTVSRLQAANVTLLATFTTGKNPRAVAFDGTKIWIANSGENSLTVIGPVTNSAALASTTAMAVAQREVDPSSAIGSMVKLILDAN